STSSAVNATLYGSARISYIVAKEGQLPGVLERKVWDRPIEGLLIVAGITLLVANLFDVTSISTMGSAGFLLIFTAVNYANFRLYKRTGANRVLAVVGAVVCAGALGALVWETLRTTPANVLVLVVMGALAFTIEGLYRAITGREIRPVFRKDGCPE
ncbi:MAG: APC family permease, partial [Candidatus Coatesbacteria bacterium]